VRKRDGSVGQRGTSGFFSEGTAGSRAAIDTAARLRALQAVTDPALSQLGVATLAHEVALRVGEALSADAMALHLLDAEGEHLTMKLLHGTKRGPHARREVAVGEGLIGGVASNGRPAVVECLAPVESISFLASPGIRSIVAVPLRALGRVMGVLSAGTTERRSFDEADVTLLSTAADRLAGTIERTRLHEAEERARASADQALRARDDFLSMASHELKTPMTSLVLLVQCLLKGQAKPAAGTEVAKRLESIERQVMRLADLTENLLDVARIQASGIGLELGAVDLGAVARAVVARASNELETSKSPVSLQVTTPVIGRWDQKRCEQMVTHLLTNAVNFGEHRPIEIEVTADAGLARLTVRDRGLGIAHHQQRRIFDRFARAPEAKNTAGLGIGLWLVRRIASALGGRVFVESAPGKGSAFTIELPLTGPTEQPTGSDATTV
jgi:signal transduction histidine kinase